MAFFTIKLAVPVQSPVWPVCPGPRSSISLCSCIIWKFFVQLELMVFPHRRPRPANTAVAKQLFQCCSVVGFGWVFFLETGVMGFFTWLQGILFPMFTCCVTSCLHRYLKQGFHLLPLRSESMTAIVPLHFTRNDHTQSFGVACAQLLLMVLTRGFDVQLTPACRYSRKYPQDCPRVSCHFFLGACDLHFL